MLPTGPICLTCVPCPELLCRGPVLITKASQVRSTDSLSVLSKWITRSSPPSFCRLMSGIGWSLLCFIICPVQSSVIKLLSKRCCLPTGFQKHFSKNRTSLHPLTFSPPPQKKPQWILGWKQDSLRPAQGPLNLMKAQGSFNFRSWAS